MHQHKCPWSELLLPHFFRMLVKETCKKSEKSACIFPGAQRPKAHVHDPVHVLLVGLNHMHGPMQNFLVCFGAPKLYAFPICKCYAFLNILLGYPLCLTTTHNFTQRSFYTQTGLHRGVFKHGGVYTTQDSFYTQKRIHRVYSFYTERNLYTKKSWHREACTHRGFYTEKPFTQSSFFTEELLHRGTFTQRSLYT